MSERLFEAFREEAEHLTEVPAFELIEQQGRKLRRRRHAVVGAAAAAVLAITGILATAGGEPQTQQPAGPGSPSVTPYPIDRMVTLDEGTYELTPSSDITQKVVRFTVPSGWNAWEGPNRFEGIEIGSTNNDPALAHTTWYAGLLAVEVEQVTSRSCRPSDLSEADSEDLVRAIVRIPHSQVISGPERTVRFGHPATHLRLRATRGHNNCGADLLFTTSTNGSIGYAGPGYVTDAWVIDAGGERPLLVLSIQSGGVPQEEVDALLSVVDSIEIVDRD